MSADDGKPNMLAAALGYAGAGLRVFPVNGGTKAPLTEHGFHDASADREQIEAWWARWPDAAIGSPEFDAVDVDLYKPEAAATWAQIRPLIPKGTPEVLTGGGGLAFYFAPGTLKDGKIGPGVDSRYAGRNYVLLPPSLHPEGGRYEWKVQLLGLKQLKPAPDLPHVSGSSSEFQHLREQMDSGAKIRDGRNKAAWWRAVAVLRSLTGTIDVGAVEQLVQAWVNANCAGDLSGVDVPKQVKGAVKFVADERAEQPPPLDEPEVAPAVEDNPIFAGLTEAKPAVDDNPIFAGVTDVPTRNVGGAGDVIAVVEPERRRLLRGGAFILDQPADIPAVWRGAAGGGTAWAVGEGLMIVGPDGVGKTSLMQQVSLGRIGLRDRVLGMQLSDDGRPLLYFALDRPAQIARSFARMVTEEDREVLDRRLIIWKGPPPFDILKEPRALADFAEVQGAGTVVIDSLKDLASKLSDDEVGGKVNAAFQELLERGIELLCGHHQRKAQAGAGAPKKLADVYGSRWLTAGMGSVFMLWGEAGDLEVECLHLKQPDEELGPWKLLHDHGAGKTVIVDQVNLLELATARGSDGLTAEQAAALLFDSSTPARNEVEKARRRLNKLTEQGFLTRTGAAPDPVIYRRNAP